jgi:hypothetical protein
LLVTVADAEGLSYYSDRTAAGLLSMEPGALSQARRDLMGAGLIAYRKPLYQVLSLEPGPVRALHREQGLPHSAHFRAATARFPALPFPMSRAGWVLTIRLQAVQSAMLWQRGISNVAQFVQPLENERLHRQSLRDPLARHC